ncbi:MAG: DUF624 domain-containing protein [Anaerolineae bacterium]|nr:DUF624 domain-containing protein [Thermoflexales bacterium]MDW8395061.1 DUF624 domain-containing protein [Anaerolineae bacterium]
MLDALRVLWKTLQDLWGEMFYLVLMNLLTLVLMLLVIPGPPAWVALCAVCNRVANDYAISWETYFRAFRAHFLKAWLYSLASLVAIALIGLNFWWYGAVFGNQEWAQWVRGAWLAAAVFWVVINFYIVAFYLEQEDRRWRIAFRNALLTAGAFPLFTLALLIVGGVIMAIAVVFTPLFVMIGPAFWALLGSEAVANRLRAWQARAAARMGESPSEQKAEQPW